ncbi:hypothetical protein TNCV_250521 [Trichonephila clavipes]|nr:hypothetical protein TNCV_250521 [Trichonephila clavipes]
MQHEDPVLSLIIQKIDQNDVSPQVSNYFINGECLLCHLSKRPSRSPSTVCLSRKHAFKIPPAPHQPVEQSQEPGETCHIDIFGPLKTTPKDDLQPDDTEVKSIVPSPRYNLMARAGNSAD